MTINIDICLHPDRGPLDAQLEDAMKALGFERRRPGYAMTRVLTGDVQTDHNTTIAEQAEEAAAEIVAEATAPAPKRERGQPSPGKQRRTKAEIAEDDAAAAAEAAIGNGNISDSPEDRQDPNNPEPTDSPEDAAQDAADEAAETAAAKEAFGGKLTLDDVKTTLGLYVKAYGLAATQEDGPKIIGTIVEGAVKVSDVPEDKIEAVIAEIKAAGKENRFKRELVAQGGAA